MRSYTSYMRIYVPLVLSELALPEIPARRVHAVTPALRSYVPNEDDEGYEFIAAMAASDDSLRLIAQQPHELKRRCFVAAEIPEDLLECPENPQLPTERVVRSSLAWRRIVSIHIDEPGSEDLVERALGDEQAFEETGDIEVMWYDVTERAALIELFVQ